MGSKQRWAVIWLVFSVFVAGTIACGLPGNSTGDQTLTPIVPSSTASASASPSLTQALTSTQTPTQPVIESLPLDTSDLAGMPTAVAAHGLPEDVHLMMLLGTNVESPYISRSNAIMLLFYNTRLARASLYSLPPDLKVYLPGVGMQRLQSAFPLGGISLLEDTLEYNLGIRPDEWAMIHLDDFKDVVNDLGKVQVVVETDLSKICPGLRAGTLVLDGAQTLCYVSFRDGFDEAARSRRQQDVFFQLFLRLVQGGNLIRLPVLYEKFHSRVATDLGLLDLTANLPLALRLGDTSRWGFFTLQEGDVVPAKIAGQIPETWVLLPQAGRLEAGIARAIDFVLQDIPEIGRGGTLAAELTTSPTATATFTRTITNTRTITLTRTITFTRTITLTRTITKTRTGTRTFTVTHTFTVTATPTITPTPSDTATPTSTGTDTMTPTPTETGTDTPTPTETPTPTGT